jgi:uracil-DNA glycosylase
MLNAVLTVRAHTPNSHKEKGWESFTDAIIRKVNEKRDPVVFVLWGGYAQKKAKLVDATKHIIIQSAHPSPLSARMGSSGASRFSYDQQRPPPGGAGPRSTGGSRIFEAPFESDDLWLL